MPQGWRAALALERRELDGQLIAYCDRTGDTFLVAPLTRAILDRLNAGPADLSALVASAAAALGGSPPADMDEVVSDTVTDLESLGIIDRVSL